jgi:hypothetical protein
VGCWPSTPRRRLLSHPARYLQFSFEPSCFFFSCFPPPSYPSAQVNGLAVVPPRLRGADDRLALALYPAAALLNHACRPNVAARFEVGRAVCVCVCVC